MDELFFYATAAITVIVFIQWVLIGVLLRRLGRLENLIDRFLSDPDVVDDWIEGIDEERERRRTPAFVAQKFYDETLEEARHPFRVRLP